MSQVEGAVVLHKGTTLGWHGQDGVRRPKPKHPLWRKRETLIQERIVEYTTVRMHTRTKRYGLHHGNRGVGLVKYGRRRFDLANKGPHRGGNWVFVHQS